MTSPTSAPVTPERIFQFAWAYSVPLVIEAAIKHRVFDVLDSGPKTLAELHAATGASARGLSRIANLLVGLNFLERHGDKYANAPEAAAFLVSTKPGFSGGLFRHTSEDLIPRWLHLNEAVATGKAVTPVNQQSGGAEFFEHFVCDIMPMSFPAAQDLAAHLALDSRPGPVRVLDLAAGSGVWSIALAQSSRKVQVTAVDWPAVLPVTKKTAERFGVGDRFSFVAGDLDSADFGTDHHVATLGHILHSEGVARSNALIAKTFAALASGGIIAIQEFLVNKDRTGPVNGLIFGVNMLIATDEGDTFSFEEIAAWLKEAGFTNPRTVEARGPSPLILATKP